MTNEMNNTVNEMPMTSMESIEAGAIELSEQDLEAVSGGLNLSFGDVDSFFQQSGNFFSGKKLSVDQATFAGPNGSGTISSIDFQQVDSGAFQNIGIG
ncbi:CTB family bacteriocin [Leptolyngbya ohadii]|uniref:CTB family bacteriocin n=1 Tax=Leptolyngbya ohadii TaxID=1962290 RepID=UPI0019D4D90E|nr:CTB family bacteriocin [Leptolyngbya ohadii]